MRFTLVLASAALLACAVEVASPAAPKTQPAVSSGPGSRPADSMPASAPSSKPVVDQQKLLRKYFALEKELAGLFQAKQYDRAEAVAREMIALMPNDAGNYYNLACAQARQGQDEQALASLTKAIELGYGYVGHMLQDEDLQTLRGDPKFVELRDKALQAMLDRYSKAVAENPKSPLARYGLGCAQAMMGRKDHALETLGKAVESGWSESERMKQEEALATLRGDKRFNELVKKASENYERGDDIAGVKTVEGDPEGGLRYRLRMAPGATKDKPDKLIVWMHPSGGSANVHVEPMSPMFITHGYALLVITRKSWNYWSEDDARRLIEKTLPDVAKVEGIDARRPILMGFSAGGQVALQLYCQDPGQFGGLVLDASYPVSQAIENGQVVNKEMAFPTGDAVRKVPILVITGTKDYGATNIDAATAEKMGAKPLCMLWRKIEKSLLDRGVPLTMVYVEGGPHGWLLRPVDKANREILDKWLGEVAAGKLPASRPASAPATASAPAE